MKIGEVLISVKRQFDIFSHMLLRPRVTSDGYPRVSVSWPDEDLLNRAKAAAKAEERSLSQWIVRAVRAYLSAQASADNGVNSTGGSDQKKRLTDLEVKSTVDRMVAEAENKVFGGPKARKGAVPVRQQA